MSKLIKLLLTITLTIPLFTFGQIKYGSNNGQYVTIKGTKVYYEEYGKGIPLLLLHGGLGNVRDFSMIIPKLSEKFRVIIPDAPGLGRSEYAKNPLSYQLLADYQSELIDKLKLDSLYVMGWSDGGNTALLLAHKRPEKVKKMIPVGANYTLKGTTEEGMVETKNISDILWVESHLQNWITYYQSLSNKDWKRYITEIKTMWLEEQYFPKSVLESIKISTLIVYGDRDMYSLEHGIEIHNAIKNSQFCVIPNCSHDVFYEKPEIITKIAIDFFEGK